MGFFAPAYSDPMFWQPFYWGTDVRSTTYGPCNNRDPDGLRGTGPNPFGYDYPFVHPSLDIQHLLADAYLSHMDHTVVLPLRIVWIAGLNKFTDCLDPGGMTPANPFFNWFGDWFGVLGTFGDIYDWFGDWFGEWLDPVGDPPPSGDENWFGDWFGIDSMPVYSWPLPPAGWFGTLFNDWFGDWFGGLDDGIPPPIPSGDYARSHDVDVVIIDATGKVVFNSTQAYKFTSQPFGNRLQIHEWLAYNGVCRIVQHTALPDPSYYRPVPEIIWPYDGRLDERVHDIVPYRVTSLGVTDQVPRIVAQGELLGGYNITFDVQPVVSGLRKLTRVTINAVPGSGLGRAPGCDEDANRLVRTVAQVPGDAYANLNIAADQCYWARPGTVIGHLGRVINPAVVLLGNDCRPCYDCDDFDTAQRALLDGWDQLRAAADQAAATAMQLQTQIDRWESQKSCRERDQVRLNAVAFYNQFIDVAVSVCNTSAQCLHDVRLVVNYTEPIGVTITLDPFVSLRTDGRGGLVNYTPEGGREGFVAARWDLLPPQASGLFRFRLNVTTAALVLITLTGSATTAGNPLPGNPSLDLSIG